MINKRNLSLGILLLLLLDASGSLYIGLWRESFWSSISNKNLNLFIYYLVIFTIVVIILCIVNGLLGYLSTRYSILWRSELTNKALTSNFKSIEGGEQRVQEDCLAYPTLSCSLTIGLLQCLLAIGTGLYVILRVLTFKFILLSIGYSALSTLIAMKIARPLIKLNYDNQVAEAAFRKTVKIDRYLICSYVNLQIANKIKHLNYFQSFYNQITVVIPFVLLAPMYFSGALGFGLLMQQTSSIRDLITNSSYILNVFDSINKWLSCRKRLKELKIL